MAVVVVYSLLIHWSNYWTKKYVHRVQSFNVQRYKSFETSNIRHARSLSVGTKI